MAMTSESPRPTRARKAPARQANSWTDEQRLQIAERAYHFFLERGGQPGYELDDWLRAESEFTAARKPARTRRVRAEA